MESSTSHQALIRRGATLTVEDIRTQAPPPGGLLIALEYAGVCGTDLQIFNGSRPDIATVLGHEGVGTVAATGKGAPLRTGDRVVFNPVAEIFAGRLLGHNVDGLFQRYVTVSAQAVDCGLVLPAQDCDPSISAALTEPLGAIIYAHELLSRAVSRLRTAVVFGAGPIGLLATRRLTEMGIQVFLVHPHRRRLDTAIQLGLVSPNAALRVCDDLPEQLLTRNNGSGFDAALICTTRQGAPLALRHAATVVGSGGCIDLITNYPENGSALGSLATESIRAIRAANVCGMPAEGAYAHADVSGRHIRVTGHRGTSATHLTKAMRELRTSATAYCKIITHVLSLDSAVTAIPILAGHGEHALYGRDCIKAVIDLNAR